MEYVDGDPIIRYADKHDLSTNGRLKIFLKICRALAYAHGNLIVHRDIKPSNIFVTSEGEPKLLDFGLAKILDLESDDVKTASSFRALTPAYASPEQIRGEPPNTSSDIYSLGVVLYELLTGTRPYSFDSERLEKMIQIASGSGPLPPSEALTRVQSEAASTKNEDAMGTSLPRRISATELKGDIDNIVLKAMKPEPARRYSSVEQFADDIERHLKNLPVTATKDTVTYRSSKFIKRHWIGVASAALIFIILISGIVATTWQARAAQRARKRSETIQAFLQTMLGSAAPEAKGTDVKVKEILADAGSRARTELANDPQAMAEVLLTLGKTYVSLTMNEQAEAELRAAMAASESSNGQDHPITVESEAWLGIALGFQNKVVEGVEVSRRSVETARKLYPNGHEDLGYGLYALALNLFQTGDAATALPIAHESSAVIRQFFGERHGYYLATLNLIGMVNETLGESDMASKYYRHTLSLGDGLDGRYHIFLAQASTYLGWNLLRQGQHTEAEVHLKNAEAIYDRVLGDSNTSTAQVKQLLGRVFLQRGEFEKAIGELSRSIAMVSFPPDHRFVLQSKVLIGLALTRGGKAEQGERDLRELVSIAEKTLKPGSGLRAEIESTLGECLTSRGQLTEAESLLYAALTVQESQPGQSIALSETKNRLSALAQANAKATRPR